MWRAEKTTNGQDLVWDGVETGIAPSPTLGTANIQNANIATESGEVLASYGRISQTPQAITNGTLTPNGATDFTGPSNLLAGQWISVSTSTVTSINTTTTPTTATISYLAVGGGGGGGGVDNSTNDTAGGGGGAGEVETDTSSVSVGSYEITIGDGGAGGTGTNPRGTNGTSTVIASIDTAIGGGGGGAGDGAGAVMDGNSGGSGGGGGADQGTGTAGTGGSGTAGNAGGAGTTAGNAGGGGGAGAVGQAGQPSSGGAGGIGVSSSISGTPVLYGGGGGGGGLPTGGGAGGDGGGGNGAGFGTGSSGSGGNATANTGGGGGGATSDSGASEFDGGNGGSGVVVISYTVGSMIATGGNITVVGNNMVHTFTESGTFKVLSITQTNLYYVSYKSGTTYRLSSKFDPTGANALTHGTTGSVTFSTVAVPNSAIAKAVEKYTNAFTVEYRYYVLDTNSYMWVFDSFIYQTYGTGWMLPDPNNYSSFRLTGIGVLNGMVMAVGKAYVFGKPVNDLGKIFIMLTDVYLNEPFPTHNNFALVGNQGKMYYCDGNYIGEVFPTTSLITSIANIQSVCSYTSTSITGTVSAVIAGSIPYSPDGTRIPVVFYTDVYGTLPTNIQGGTVYYIDYNPDINTFSVYPSLTIESVTTTTSNLSGATSATLTADWSYPSGDYLVSFTSGDTKTVTFTNGSDAISWSGGLTNNATNTITILGVDIATGEVGNQFFTTFWPFGAGGTSGSTPLVQVSTQRVNLPANEVAQCMVEIGNTVLIGGITNTVYPWNQIDAIPSDFIALPETNVKNMINVNNMAYIFAGNKGNIYISNSSVASLALKVPDYCAGISGTPLTYIEPYFTWGDATYIRGRVYFSILDQTSTKAGNCGGIWSFIPPQNVDPSQEIGMALRLENQNSYGDYDGYATILIPNEEQNAISPQYWSWWQDSYSTGASAFGVDYTNTVPVTKYVIETDLAPTGTMLKKETFAQLEYKLTTPLTSGDSIQVYWRLNSTDAWVTAGTVQEEVNRIAGYFPQKFQKTQWVQFRIEVTLNGTTTSSFGRLKQLRLR